MAKVMHMSVRSRYRLLVVCTVVAFVYLISPRSDDFAVPADSLQGDFFSWHGPDYVPGPKPPYKAPREPTPPVPDPFPLLSSNDIRPAQRAALLRTPLINRPPKVHYAEATPLFIGFTRNWPQLLQCVSSYLAAGWPAQDIYIVENTGTMLSNVQNKLTLQNPFYLNHTQLAMLGVNVLITPTLLTFAQLQNFYAWTALERKWEQYFWSHQDIMVFSLENDTYPEDAPMVYNDRGNSPVTYSLYDRAVGVLQFLRSPGAPKWANHFFAYDHLTLVNRDALLDVGGWDTHIPFYATDCDMYVRLMWAGYWQGETEIGIILDVATVMEDLGAVFRVPGVKASFKGDPKGKEEKERRLGEDEGETYEHLLAVAKRMEEAKYVDGDNAWRNRWQLSQTGGQGEPFARDYEGFETGLRMFIDTGRAVFAEKWGHRGCDIVKMGMKAEDAWQLERDWDPETQGLGHEGDEW
ncbi:hypothetical protein B0T16DRAFT_338141 [Cercophora newfieldiana]|uniref:Uncharacterized protein n=1 Tax=Cercophora newfieldiana TaxID=92897 RepID=A0AA39XRX3_9PEZI|nr:hypothetical protein B0T16DRAFT_338141 [Cercophora newfieldiana]